MDQIPDTLRQALAELLLGIADDKLVLGQREADWTGLGPILEEDIAFSSMAQDEIGHASSLYDFVADLRRDGRTADQIAYGRRPEEYRCAELVVRDDGFDWAVALVRQFFCDHFDTLRLTRLTNSSVASLAGLARRLLAEEQIHVSHANEWIARLGRGGSESHDRVQAALNSLAPLAHTLFEPTLGQEQIEAAGVYPPSARPMFAAWRAALEPALSAGKLRLDIPEPEPGQIGGRRGRHSPDFVELLREMTEVAGVEPDAQW